MGKVITENVLFCFLKILFIHERHREREQRWFEIFIMVSRREI